MCSRRLDWASGHFFGGRKAKSGVRTILWKSRKASIISNRNRTEVVNLDFLGSSLCRENPGDNPGSCSDFFGP